MDIERIHAAVAAYVKDASPADAARLEFFEGLFDIQAQRENVIAADCGYDAPAPADAFALYRAKEPVFAKAPVAIDAGQFGESCQVIAEYMAEKAGLESNVAFALRSYGWDDFGANADLQLAGSDPAGFIESMLQRIDSLGVSADVPSSVFMMVPLFALRCHLGPAAAACEKSYHLGRPEDEAGWVHPLDCPICGTPSAAAWVGSAAGTDGRGREEYCSQCGHQWEFERIRCSNCGSTNQNKLHYVNIEGDRAHRLLKCDDCGAYERVVFQEDLEVSPLSMEVEDVVMAKIDQVAIGV